ncbi:MAG: NUDIX domain-containing protein [Actinomycetota bacterium]|nr:NUDIX domain-containing protein [Actinomycetota bacterium]
MGNGKTSAGLILYRRRDGELEVLIAHMGGPYWANKKRGWSIPKGEYAPDEDPLACARREFEEETGSAPPVGEPLDLGEIVQKSGKRVRAWALEGDLDPAGAFSNHIEIEWPPRSGRLVEIPEVDRVEWFRPDEAKDLVIKAQGELFDRLRDRLIDGS